MIERKLEHLKEYHHNNYYIIIYADKNDVMRNLGKGNDRLCYWVVTVDWWW